MDAPPKTVLPPVANRVRRKRGAVMFGLGPMELAIVGIIAVLLFGKRLPEVGRSSARARRIQEGDERHQVRNGPRDEHVVAGPVGASQFGR